MKSARGTIVDALDIETMLRALGLKALNMKAQGNALGSRSQQSTKP